jgi:2'-5' RNA ligase
MSDEPKVEEPKREEPKREEPKSQQLFFAVNLQVTPARRVADAMTKLRAQSKAVKISWVPAANLHVTLKYLGWAKPEILPALREAMGRVVAGRKGFEIATRGWGGFPDLQSPRVLFAAVTDPSGGLLQLAQAVDVETTRLGFAGEKRAYHPHVTIGRVKDPAGWNPELLAGEPSFGSSQIREIVLYESRVKSSGSEYIALARAAFGIPERQTRGLEEEGTRSEEPEAHGRQQPT